MAFSGIERIRFARSGCAQLMGTDGFWAVHSPGLLVWASSQLFHTVKSATLNLFR